MLPIHISLGRRVPGIHRRPQPRDLVPAHGNFSAHVQRSGHGPAGFGQGIFRKGLSLLGQSPDGVRIFLCCSIRFIRRIAQPRHLVPAHGNGTGHGPSRLGQQLFYFRSNRSRVRRGILKGQRFVRDGRVRFQIGNRRLPHQVADGVELIGALRNIPVIENRLLHVNHEPGGGQLRGLAHILIDFELAFQRPKHGNGLRREPIPDEVTLHRAFVEDPVPVRLLRRKYHSAPGIDLIRPIVIPESADDFPHTVPLLGRKRNGRAGVLQVQRDPAYRVFHSIHHPFAHHNKNGGGFPTPPPQCFLPELVFRYRFCAPVFLFSDSKRKRILLRLGDI